VLCPYRTLWIAHPVGARHAVPVCARGGVRAGAHSLFVVFFLARERGFLAGGACQIILPASS